MGDSACSLTARAIVVESFPDGTVNLEFEGAERCAGCSGVCMWKRIQTMRLAGIQAGARFEPGASVVVALPERYVLLGSLLVHGLPLFGLLLGGLVGAGITGTDSGAVAGAVLVTVAIYLLTPALRVRVERATLGKLQLRALQ